MLKNSAGPSKTASQVKAKQITDKKSTRDFSGYKSTHSKTKDTLMLFTSSNYTAIKQIIKY